MKKILFLGGSLQQIPPLRYAREQGYYTILCDYLADNPGQRFVDRFYCVSTTNKEAVLNVAKKENIDGIVAYASDPAAPTAAYVAEKLNLPTNPYKSVKVLTNKDKFREFLKNHNFNTPRSESYDSYSEAKKNIGNFKLPVMLKPVDSSGSKGVSKLVDIINLKEQFENALKHSMIKKVIIEEYVEMAGYQIAGDGFSVDGQLVFRCFANDHFNKSSANPYVPISASFPYNNPETVQDKIHREIQRLLDLLKMGTGAYNFDVRIDQEENVYLMEVGPRNGGNFIPQVIKYATGVDMLKYTIKAALGEDCSKLTMKEPKGFWSYYSIHSLDSGILKEINILDSVLKTNIVESFINYKPGDLVPSFEGANASLGILIMKFKSMDEMLYMMENSEKWINVILE